MNIDDADTSDHAPASPEIAEFSSFVALLNSWARLYDQTESWPDACRQWSALQESSAAFTQAYPVFEKLFLYTNDKESAAFESVRRNFRRELSHAGTYIVIDGDGRIERLSNDAGAMFGLAPGQVIDAALTESTAALFETVRERPHAPTLVELTDRKGLRRLCAAVLASGEAAAGESGEEKLLLALQTVSLPPAAERYMRDTLTLTASEIDIVARALRRQDLDAIAAERASTLNTVRTHIAKITRKFGARNFTDVIARAGELVSYFEKDRAAQFDLRPRVPPALSRVTSRIKLPGRDATLEYARYGASGGRPILLLHSFEYGYAPTTGFIDEAVSRGYAIYAPMRPGFGRSTPAKTVRDSAAAVGALIEQLDLDDVTVVALSTAAPTSLFLSEVCDRVGKVVLVNFALDIQDKISRIRPRWVRGLIDLGLKSRQSFSFAYRMSSRMYRAVGYRRFYQQLYKSCDFDLAYIEANSDDAEFAGDSLFSADPESVRTDILSSFDPAFPIEWDRFRRRDIACVFGEETHGVDSDEARARAAEMGFAFSVIRGAGRNCAFQAPVAFFDAIEARVAQAAGA